MFREWKDLSDSPLSGQAPGPNASPNSRSAAVQVRTTSENSALARNAPTRDRCPGSRTFASLLKVSIFVYRFKSSLTDLAIVASQPDSGYLCVMERGVLARLARVSLLGKSLMHL